jgi:hypothetical protein
MERGRGVRRRGPALTGTPEGGNRSGHATRFAVWTAAALSALSFAGGFVLANVSRSDREAAAARPIGSDAEPTARPSTIDDAASGTTRPVGEASSPVGEDGAASEGAWRTGPVRAHDATTPAQGAARSDALVAGAAASTLASTSGPASAVVTLHVELAADPEAIGPPGWTLLRERAVAAFADGGGTLDAAALDPFAPLALTLEFASGHEPRVLAAASTDPLPTHLYLRGRLELRADDHPQTFVVTGDCTPNGHARAKLETEFATEADEPACITVLRRALGIRRGEVLCGLEVGALCGVAASARGEEPHDPASAEPSHGIDTVLLAAWCGPLDALALRETPGAFVGQSDAGLLLPAALLLTAADGLDTHLTAGGPAERLALRATLGTRTDRIDAALRLGRMDQAILAPGSERAQEDLDVLARYGDDTIRTAAALALAPAPSRAEVAKATAALLARPTADGAEVSDPAAPSRFTPFRLGALALLLTTAVGLAVLLARKPGAG